MPIPQVDTVKQFNNLIEFRQSIYENGFEHERNAQFELVDALVSGRRVRSFAELTLAPHHRRGWSSSYQALKRGRQNQAALTAIYARQLPSAGVAVLALDATKWAHPEAKTLAGLTLEPYQRRVTPVHLYSKLAWVPTAGSSWALPLSTLRARPEETEVAVGVRQVARLQTHLPSELSPVVAADGRYGNHLFVVQMAAMAAAFVVRLAKNRVFYGPPGPYSGRGRPRIHGHRFDFKDPVTWLPPDETVTLDHPTYGTVRLRRWEGLHDRQAPTLPLTLLLAEIHQERAHPPQPLWLAYRGPRALTAAIWGWYLQRWPIEPAIRFRKQRLYWTLPRLQQDVRCDRWTTLVDIAYWQVWLARHLVKDYPLPWQKPQAVLKPERILAGTAVLLARLPTVTTAVQPRGKSSGWPRGRLRSRLPRFPPLKRGRKRG